MSILKVVNQFQIRRDVSSEWTRVNPVLRSGEPAYEEDTRKLKIGDGETAWAELPYFTAAGPEPLIPSEDDPDLYILR